MASITVKNSSGKDAGNLELDEAMFGVQPNVPLMHQVVTAQLAARRSGTQSTKTRAEVRGGGKKPFKQKGTGNARQGSTRSPHMSGGGVAHGPKPRKYDQKTPKKMIKLALRSALSDRAADGKVVVVDSWGFDAPKTKDAKKLLSALGVEGSALVVVDIDETNTIKSFLNLPEVQLIESRELNAYDVLCSDYVIFSHATLPGGGEVLEKPAKKATAKKAAPAKKAAAKSAGGEGSASDEPQAARGESEADDEPAIPKGAHAATEDGEPPRGYKIKGNADSGLYHVPGSAFYDRTVAELWFKTAEDAKPPASSCLPVNEPSPQIRKKNEGPSRHHPGTCCLREELRLDRAGCVHVHRPPERQQAGDLRRCQGDLGRRRRPGQHPQPEGQGDARSSQQPHRFQARHQAGTRQAGGGQRDPAVRELS
jgi:large subunit ribosomal protein L4